jgi:AcrR family transcriptional regulator
MASGKHRDEEDPAGADHARPSTGSALRDLVAEKVAEKLTEKATKYDLISAKAAGRAAAIERAASYLGALDVWTRIEPAARRPRFTRDDITHVAIRIADREGIDAVSMRRIAAELGAGTMTLYHYVRTKDELLALVVDAIMGEIVLAPTEPMPANWRDAITVVAERSRDALRRHTWILDIADDPPIGPNSVRHFDQSLEAVASLPISFAEKLDIVTVVDEYVFGYSLLERNNQQSVAPSVPTDMITYVSGLVETGEYPQLAALAAEVGIEAGWHQVEAHLRDEDRFGRNLAHLLDGIEANLPAPATDAPAG